MKPRLAFLITTSALTLALGLPTLAAIRAAEGCAPALCAAPADGTVPLIQVDDDHKRGWFRLWRGGHDDDDDEDDDDDDCDDDDDDDDCRSGRGGKGNPAPAGTAAPPANGLFGNGAPPRAVTN